MKIILTGANGFLGRSVYAAFANRGHEVLSIVRTPSGIPDEVVFDLMADDYAILDNLIEQCNCIVHLAAVVGFAEGFIEELYDVNYLATLRIVKIAARYQKHILFSSSASISKAKDGVINNQSADFPESSYALSKYLAEKAIETFLQNYCIIRIGGIYGLSGPEHLYLNKAIRLALTEGTAPTIFGRGKSRRNYVYVKDLAVWIVLLSESKVTGKFLIGGGETMAIGDILTRLAQKYLGSIDSVTNVEADETRDFIIAGENAPFQQRTYSEAFLDIRKDFTLIA